MGIHNSAFIFKKHLLSYPVHFILLVTSTYLISANHFSSFILYSIIFALVHTFVFILGYTTLKTWQDKKMFLQSLVFKRFPQVPFDLFYALIIPTILCFFYLKLYPLKFNFIAIYLQLSYHFIICLISYLWINITERNNMYIELKNELLEVNYNNNMLQKESINDMISPHFLFNSLNTLTGILYESKGKAILFTSELSYLYDYILNNKSKKWIALEEEVNLIHRYVFLLQSRFENTLHVNISIPNEILNTKIPPLCLQNLIENAIKHNALSKKKPLTINVFYTDKYLNVKNTKNMKNKPVENSTGFGLNYITQHYKTLNKKVIIADFENSFEVKLPIIFN